jgi:hypothetical protein
MGGRKRQQFPQAGGERPTGVVLNVATRTITSHRRIVCRVSDCTDEACPNGLHGSAAWDRDVDGAVSTVAAAAAPSEGGVVCPANADTPAVTALTWH